MTEDSNVHDDSGQESTSGSVGTEPVGDAAKEVRTDVKDAESNALVGAETSSPGWDEALAYADYLHTDAVLLVLGVWICAGVMLARILLDRVVP